MILPSNLNGLGFDPSLLTQQTGYRPGAEPPVSTGAAPGFSITQHRWEQIIEEQSPGWYADYALVKSGNVAQAEVNVAARTSALEAKWRALAAGLPTCPIESITDGGASCYFGSSRGQAALTTNNIDDPWGLVMPGTFVIDGVPMTPMDYKDGRITRVFQPDALQRKLLEHTVIRASMIRLFGSDKAMSPIYRQLVGTGVIRDAMRAYVIQKTNGQIVPSQDYLENMGATVSVDEMMAMVPDIKLFLVNFLRNPIQPNYQWRLEPGGWKEWISNGGYPLSYDVAHAKTTVSQGAMNPELCESILCQCPADGRPSCVPITLSKAAGITQTGGGWWPYVAIYQDVSNPLWELSLVYDDPSWIKRIGEQLGSWMTSLGKIFCGIGLPAASKQMTKAQADVCTNAQGNTCARGTPGCTCRPAPNASTTSVTNMNPYVAAYTQVTGKLCEGWAEQEFGNQMPTVDPASMFQPTPPAPPFKVTPMMVALGLAAVGAAVVLTRKKP